MAIANSAFAQSGSPVSVSVPFDFYVGNKRMPAGNYQISSVNRASFLIRDTTGENIKMLVHAPLVVEAGAGKVTRESLVFNRYGNQYFLREVYAQTSALGKMLYESKAEKNVRRNVQDQSASTRTPERISVGMQ
jgi:hypothetical protein